jgi:hypothetical protein
MNRKTLSAAVLLIGLAAATSACKTTEGAEGPKKQAPTETQTVSNDALPDPMTVAQAWAESPEFDGLSREVEERASSWKAGQVARIYAVTEGYKAVVHNYTTARDAPAVLLTIAQDASGRWRVVDAKLARTTHMWPEL